MDYIWTYVKPEQNNNKSITEAYDIFNFEELNVNFCLINSSQSGILIYPQYMAENKLLIQNNIQFILSNCNS